MTSEERDPCRPKTCLSVIDRRKGAQLEGGAASVAPGEQRQSTFSAQSVDDGGNGELVLVPVRVPSAGPSAPKRCQGPSRRAVTRADPAYKPTTGSQLPLTQGRRRRHRWSGNSKCTAWQWSQLVARHRRKASSQGRYTRCGYTSNAANSLMNLVRRS